MSLPSPSYRPTPPSSPVEGPQSPTDEVSPIQNAVKSRQDAPILEQALLRLTEVLATALEALTKVSNIPSVGKTPKAKEDQPQVERASTLDYKRVDEVYVLMS